MVSRIVTTAVRFSFLVLALAAATVPLGGCGDNDEATAPVESLTAISFNVHGRDAIADPVIGQAIADQIDAIRPEFSALQECVSCELLLARLPAGYSLVADNDAAVAIMYRTEAWEVVESGLIVLGENDDGWGSRKARWAVFHDLESEAEVRVYSTHWCVTIRNPDDGCDVDKHLVYAGKILDHIATRALPTILGGDFNVFDGFEDGPVIEFLGAHGLVDTLRQVSEEEVITYQGNDSFPPGRIDYVFASRPVDVTDAGVDLESASDHRPVRATLSFPEYW